MLSPIQSVVSARSSTVRSLKLGYFVMPHMSRVGACVIERLQGESLVLALLFAAMPLMWCLKLAQSSVYMGTGWFCLAAADVFLERAFAKSSVCIGNGWC